MGADSVVTGPTGAGGAAGAASTVTGPTGPVGSGGAAGAASTITGPTGPVGSGGAASTVTGPAGVLSTTVTPNASVDTAQNIKTSLVSSVLNVDYTTLYNKLSTYGNIPRIQGYVNSAGTVSNGIGTITVTGKTTGTYPLTLSGATTGYPIVQCITSSAGNNYNANITAWAGSSCTIVIKNESNALVDASFWFTVF